MNKNLFGVMVVFAIIVVLLSFKATNRRPKPHELEINPHQIQNPTSATNRNLKQTIPIHLSIGSFDPLSENSPTTIARELIIQNYEESENGCYILQFKGAVLQQWKDEVITDRASFFDYTPPSLP